MFVILKTREDLDGWFCKCIFSSCQPLVFIINLFRVMYKAFDVRLYTLDICLFHRYIFVALAVHVHFVVAFLVVVICMI